MVKHIFLRVLAVIFLSIVGGFVGSILSSDAQCGTGAILGIVLTGFLFLILAILILFIESYFLNKRKEIKKRNINLILAISLLIICLFFVSSFVW